MNEKKGLCLVGTRHEAINTAPIVLALKQVQILKVSVLAFFSDSEIDASPFQSSELAFCMQRVSQRMGVSARADDDLSDYFWLDEY